MDDSTEPLTIGQLSKRTKVPVRTIRFWSDIGLIPPSARSAGGYRLYAPEAVARLELVATLRDLGIDLPTVQRVLSDRATVAEVARTHVAALDAEIRILRIRRAVLRSMAERDNPPEEMRTMHKLARLSTQERQRIVGAFIGEVCDGADPESFGARIAHTMAQSVVELPDDPTTQQVDAWVELTELMSDPGFRQRVRQMMVAAAENPAEPWQPPFDPQMVLERACEALDSGVAPESERAGAILDGLIDPDMPVDERVRLADELETFTDRSVERYWQLAGMINGRPPFPSKVPAFEWFIAALRAGDHRAPADRP
ncbi:helix-turn-helix domain-containing protein [Microtetraspora niveoalba]|uniref:helix-turn-helix domain-containing protein n=1 Tax=Microtetraspora niveoalba TaxID=46175 RepID=UPI000831586E|nr:MerR family transcriptional regulator [Microtetraspora niveoalba]